MAKKAKEGSRSWELTDSQKQVAITMFARHNDEVAMIKRHQMREIEGYINTLRRELSIPNEMEISINVDSMVIAEVTKKARQKV